MIYMTGETRMNKYFQNLMSIKSNAEMQISKGNPIMETIKICDTILNFIFYRFKPKLF